MKARVVAGLVVVVLALGGILIGGKLVWDGMHKMKLQGTTDEAKIKGTIRGALDSWLGYSVLDSNDLHKRMRAAGYQLDWKDDGADYPSRFAAFSEGKYDFVVATVDSYVLGGQPHKYPGPIIAVLDESKGDAIIARDAIKDVNGLNDPAVKIALTPASPSEFLLKSVGSHFGLPKLKTKGPWRIDTNGSSDALKLLQDGKVDAAVLWEPDVSTAREMAGFHYLVGSDKSRRLIVDILIVRQDYLADHPDVVETLLREYFLALKGYRSDPDRLILEVSQKTKKPSDVLKKALAGVSFVGFLENCEQWMGVPSAPGTTPDEGLIDTIESTIRIFEDEGDLGANPMPDGNPYAIVSTKSVTALVEKGLGGGARFDVPGATPAATPAVEDVPPLDDAGWAALRTVGSLKLRPILFQSGTSILTTEGKAAIDETAEALSHYPNFRIRLRGHAAPGGDEDASKALSLDRAEAVGRYLELVHKFDPDRVRPEGLGGAEPLPMEPDENERAYRYRLPRVEFQLLTEVI
ncbi:MAG: OmpA family protein [Acidobacteriota bacterium]